MTAVLPASITRHLWDTDLSNLDLEHHYQNIIEKILEYGDFDSLCDLKKIFSKQQIISTLKNSRRLSAKSATFFSNIYKIAPSEIQALQNPFTRKQDRFANV